MLAFRVRFKELAELSRTPKTFSSSLFKFRQHKENNKKKNRRKKDRQVEMGGWREYMIRSGIKYSMSALFWSPPPSSMLTVQPGGRRWGDGGE